MAWKERPGASGKNWKIQRVFLSLLIAWRGSTAFHARLAYRTYKNSSRSWSGKVFCVWNELNRYRRLPKLQRLLFWEALGALALARFAMVCLPFKRIAAWLGTPGTESPLTATAEQVHIASEIGWAVGCLARRVPWDSRCLAQALA